MSSLTDTDFAAMGALAKARRDNLRTIFQGTQLKYGLFAKEGVLDNLKAWGGEIKNKGMTINSIRSGITSLASGTGAATLAQIKSNLGPVFTDAVTPGDFVGALGGNFTQVMGEVTPVLGAVTSTLGAAKDWVKVAVDAYHKHQVKKNRHAVQRGDPLAALSAVETIINRDLISHSVDASRNTAAAGVKIAGLFADLGVATGPAVGLANTLAGLVHELVRIGIDVKEMRAANVRLEDPGNLDITVFNACPLLGCYLLTCSDTSNVVEWYIADMGMAGWMDRVEKSKKKLDKILKIANSAICDSRLTLEGLGSDKGKYKEMSSVKRSVISSKYYKKYQEGLVKAKQFKKTVANKARSAFRRTP